MLHMPAAWHSLIPLVLIGTWFSDLYWKAFGGAVDEENEKSEEMAEMSPIAGMLTIPTTTSVIEQIRQNID